MIERSTATTCGSGFLDCQNEVIHHSRRESVVYYVTDGSSEAARYRVSTFPDMDPEVYSSGPSPADMLV